MRQARRSGIDHDGSQRISASDQESSSARRRPDGDEPRDTLTVVVASELQTWSGSQGNVVNGASIS